MCGFSTKGTYTRMSPAGKQIEILTQENNNLPNYYKGFNGTVVGLLETVLLNIPNNLNQS